MDIEYLTGVHIGVRDSRGLRTYKWPCGHLTSPGGLLILVEIHCLPALIFVFIDLPDNLWCRRKLLSDQITNNKVRMYYDCIPLIVICTQKLLLTSTFYHLSFML